VLTFVEYQFISFSVYYTDRPPKLTTFETVDVQSRNFSKSRVSDKVPGRSILILVIREFSSNAM